MRVDVVSNYPKRLAYEPIRRAIRSAFTSAEEETQISVLLTTDEEVARLNRDFRGLDEATDVLTFPSIENPLGHLGDIAISVDTAERQARARGSKRDVELQFLAIHGALHLQGMDDQSERERKAMIDKMNEIAFELGLPPDPDWSSIHH
ncbi:MAG: rRNA maturation RNase YbeY [Armatimonadetes bacterium]|nr:rRNA maturation RNase YbeY [Armatimonadota bacterium]